MSSENNKTRHRILMSALTLLEEGGGGAVRMSDIAKASKISRQALYLHFANRAELLVAATRYLDEVYDSDTRLEKSRSMEGGVERLEAWVDVWGDHIPRIYGVAKALLAMRDSDEEARIAWDDRMRAVRHGCAAVVSMLLADGKLKEGLTEAEATDLLWTLMSVQNWGMLRYDCHWSQDRYIQAMKTLTKQALVNGK